MKTCTCCGLEKSLNEFKKDRRKTVGVAAYCKMCSAHRCAAYRAATPAKPDLRRGQKRDRSVYRAANRGRLRAATRKWEQNNPDKLRVTWRNKRANRRAAEGHHTADDIERIRKLQRNRCAYCRRSLLQGFHVDHIKPLSRRGTNWPNNLQLACGPCNIQKHARDPIQFAQQLGMLL